MKIALKRIFNAANLHIGGGVQVAASFVSEYASSPDTDDRYHFLLSQEVARNVPVPLEPGGNGDWYEITDIRGIDPAGHANRRLMDDAETVFTLFGPLYRWRPPFRSIVGFAQAWIIYPENECYARMGLLQRLKTKAKFRVQAMFFKRADLLVVELQHVKDGLIRELGIPADRISVVHNCLSSIYRQKENWQHISIPEHGPGLKLGFVGRNYLHKNTGIFPGIVNRLRTEHGLDARFYVTFTEQEWSACSPEFKEACINVGPLSVAQCPPFYRSLDAVVFPSLLESFSATPLEAMAMEKPLFASNRPFNRDVCAHHAFYFDPMAPETAALKIAEVFGGNGPDATALRSARDHAIAFANPADRAMKYRALLDGKLID